MLGGALRTHTVFGNDSDDDVESVSLLSRPAASLATLTGTVVAEEFVLDVSREDLDIGESIGRGRFKEVFCGAFRGHEDVVVLRCDAERDAHELDMLRVFAANRVSSRYIPHIYGLCHEGPGVLLVQERAMFGSLKTVLTDSQLEPLVTTFHRLLGVAQLARAMDFVSSRRVIHADLSCRNVLLFHLSEVGPEPILLKITDFGLSILLEPAVGRVCCKMPHATRWCSPESVANQEWSHQSDVWSLGVTLWEFFASGSLPWQRIQKRMHVAVQLKRLAKYGKVGVAIPCADGSSFDDVSADFPRSSYCPVVAHRLILRCLQVNELCRPAFADLATEFDNIILGPSVATLELPKDMPEDIEDVPSTPSVVSSTLSCPVSPLSGSWVSPVAESFAHVMADCQERDGEEEYVGREGEDVNQDAVSGQPSPLSMGVEAAVARELYFADLAERRAASPCVASLKLEAEAELARSLFWKDAALRQTRSCRSHHKVDNVPPMLPLLGRPALPASPAATQLSCHQLLR